VDLPDSERMLSHYYKHWIMTYRQMDRLALSRSVPCMAPCGKMYDVAILGIE